MRTSFVVRIPNDTFAFARTTKTPAVWGGGSVRSFVTSVQCEPF